MGEELWHRHVLDLTDRLRIFVSKNKSADSASLPARVKLMLQYVNKWLGAALGHLQDDDPAWWTKFSRALTCIKFNTPKWTMALVNSLSRASSDHQRSRFKKPRDYNRGRYLEKALPRKEKGVLGDIRAMIPVNRHGEEPSLRYLGGYRPSKNLILDVLARLCKEYHNLDKLQTIAAGGVRVELTVDKPTQENLPPNHGSAVERVNILRKNAHKEQDAWRCLVLDNDLLKLWPEVFISPFGIVDKTGGDPSSTRRTIHDLSFRKVFRLTTIQIRIRFQNLITSIATELHQKFFERREFSELRNKNNSS